MLTCRVWYCRFGVVPRHSQCRPEGDHWQNCSGVSAAGQVLFVTSCVMHRSPDRAAHQSRCSGQRRSWSVSLVSCTCPTVIPPHTSACSDSDVPLHSHPYPCRQQARVKAISSPTADFLLERPQPAPLLLPDAEGLAAESTTIEGSPQRDISADDTRALSPEPGELMPSVPPSNVDGCTFCSTRACWRCSRYNAHRSAVDWKCSQEMASRSWMCCRIIWSYSG